MGKYGYEVCLMNSIYCANKKYNMIDGYDSTVLYKYLPTKTTVISENPGDYPDIFIILNESLGNLQYTSNIAEGFEALKSINLIDNIKSGYTVVPLIGGGTNCSEYELLTSNSLYQISTASPFATLDLSNADSIVRHLKSLGYTTTAMHCYSKDNYARDTAYPALGFDSILLGKDNFTYNKYGNREWLDIDNYNDVLDLHKKATDHPMFIYLLTFQNHGGYEQNDQYLDTINIQNDLGHITDDVNEYLTSVESGSNGFHYFISELSKSERPCIVLMVGDHNPSFISELPLDNKGINSSIVQRTVPFYVWSNIPLKLDVFNNITTLTDLLPLFLKSANLPLSSYYQYINDLHKKIPIRTSDGLYIDSEGREIMLNSNDDLKKLIRDYYYMEYNNIVHGDDYIYGLFNLN